MLGVGTMATVQQNYLITGSRESFSPINMRVMSGSSRSATPLPPDTPHSNLLLHKVDVATATILGRMQVKDIPELTSRTVRLYVCCDETDMSSEQAHLLSVVYQQLQAYIRERHGLDLVIIDPRWGEDSGAGHNNLRQNLQEIEETANQSQGPWVLALIGEKYGDISLPSHLSHDHYEPIRTQLRDTGYDLEWLDSWYCKNSNAVPTEYVLQSPARVLGSDLSSWPDVQKRLHLALVDGATVCVQDGRLPPVVLDSLTKSDVELELSTAIDLHQQMAPLDGRINILYVVRTIRNLDQYMDRRRAEKFMDLGENSNSRETQKMEQQTSLRERVREENSVHEVTVDWIDPEGICLATHRNYIYKLGREIFTRLQEAIDHRQIPLSMRSHDLGPLYEDVVGHWQMARNLAQGMINRPDCLEKLTTYLTSETSTPFIIYGSSGSGKTSLLAQLALQLPVLVSSVTMNPFVCLRFCGRLPGGRNIPELLVSLVRQLQFIHSGWTYDQDIPHSYQELHSRWLRLLSTGPFPSLVVILIDAIDHLPSSAHLHWLPAHLSKNIKMIVSCGVSDEGGQGSLMYQRLCRMVPDSLYYLRLAHLSAGESSAALTDHLTQYGRHLTFPQWRSVKSRLDRVSPLYVRVVGEIARHWSAHDTVGDIPRTVVEGLRAIVDRLGQEENEVLVQRVVGYLTICHNGLSEQELLDVLSLDDTVLNIVHRTVKPDIRRFPPMTWCCIKQFLSPWLIQWGVDGTTVWGWRHPAVREALTHLYLGEESVVVDLHNHLVDLYLGVWSRMNKKPFKYPTPIVSKYHLSTDSSAEVRYVPEQPLKYNTFNYEERFNYRKLSQLPYHLLKSQRVQELNTEVLFNFDWIYCKLQAASMASVLSDYDLVQSADCEIVRECLRLAEPTLTADVKLLGVELSARLLGHAQRSGHLLSLVQQCDAHAQALCPLVPLWQMFDCRGGPLDQTYELLSGNQTNGFQQDIDTDVLIVEPVVSASPLLLIKSKSKMATQVVDLVQGFKMADWQLPVASEIFTVPSGDYLYVVSKKILQLFSVHGRRLIGHFNLSSAINNCDIGCVYSSENYFCFTTTTEKSPVVIDTTTMSLLHKYPYTARVVVIRSDGKCLVTNDGKKLIFHPLPMLNEHLHAVTLDRTPVRVVYSAHDQSRVYIMDDGKAVSLVRVQLNRRTSQVQKMHSDQELKNFKLSNQKERYMLVHCSRMLLVYDTNTLMQVSSMGDLPPVYMEQLSPYIDADFTPDDTKVVSIRHVYLAVWDSQTGVCLRCLQSGLLPLTSLLVCRQSPLVVTTNVQTAQVWRMEQLEYSTSRHHMITPYQPTTCLSTSSNGTIVAAFSSPWAEVRVHNITTGSWDSTLEHSTLPGIELREVLVSPQGSHVISRAYSPVEDVEDAPVDWRLLRDEKVWNLASRQVTYSVYNNRYVTFSPAEDKIVFIKCTNFDSDDRLAVQYELEILPLNGDQPWTMALPQGELVCAPVITNTGRILAFLIQTYRPLTQDGSPHGGGGNPGERQGGSLCSTGKGRGSITLMLYSFERFWRGFKYFSPVDLWTGYRQVDVMVDLQAYLDDVIFVTISQEQFCLTHDQDGQVTRNRRMKKGALLYDVFNDNVMRRMDDFLDVGSNIDLLVWSHRLSYVMDHKGTIFSTIDNQSVNNLDITKYDRRQICFLLDGTYVALLRADRRALVVLRCRDSMQYSLVDLHTTAVELRKVRDDRTLAVSTTDGQLMLVMTTLSEPNHVTVLTNPLLSRQLNQSNATLLEDDIANSRKDDYLQMRVGKVLKACHEGALQLKEPFHAVYKGAFTLQNRNQVCVLQ